MNTTGIDDVTELPLLEMKIGTGPADSNEAFLALVLKDTIHLSRILQHVQGELLLCKILAREHVQRTCSNVPPPSFVRACVPNAGRLIACHVHLEWVSS